MNTTNFTMSDQVKYYDYQHDEKADKGIDDVSHVTLMETVHPSTYEADVYRRPSSRSMS